jgi:tripartite-type tricarboxylate transporter receptor subunit TctC
MKLPRRNFLHLVAGAAALPAVSRIAAAQAYPTRPATIVVTFPPGSGSDILARILGPRLSELLGQQVIIESVGAGGGITGAYRVARAAPDGYQFVLGGTDTFATKPNALQESALQRYDRLRAGRAHSRAGVPAGHTQ